MAERDHRENEITEDRHVHEADPVELEEEEALARLQSEDPGPDVATGEDTEAHPGDVGADLGSGGAGTTADPGRENPIVPGEGRR